MGLDFTGGEKGRREVFGVRTWRGVDVMDTGVREGDGGN